jgi:hypothetical protein
MSGSSWAYTEGSDEIVPEIPSTLLMDVSRWRCLIDIVGPDGTVWVTRVLTGPGNPDLGDVDELASLQLSAGRIGGRIVLDAACPRLLELLELAGLPVEVREKAEDGEELLGAQERIDPDDPAG